MFLEDLNRLLKMTWLFVIVDFAYIGFIFYWIDWRHTPEHDAYFGKQDRVLEVIKGNERPIENSKIQYYLTGKIDGKIYTVEVNPETYFSVSNKPGKIMHFSFSEFELQEMQEGPLENVPWQHVMICACPLILFTFNMFSILYGFRDMPFDDAERYSLGFFLSCGVMIAGPILTGLISIIDR